MAWTVQEASAYLSGIIDGEGCVSKHDTRSNRKIQIGNTDPLIIAAVKECLDLLGVTYKVYEYVPKNERWSTSWHFCIGGRKNICRLAAYLNLRSSKRELLRKLLAEGWQSKRSFQPYPEQVCREYREGASARSLARTHRVSPATIQRILAKNDVELRSQGDAVRLARSAA